MSESLDPQVATNENDTRSWVDRMFTDWSANGKVPLEVVAHDCIDNQNLSSVTPIPNTISLLVDMAASTSSKLQLKGEHVLVIGGNRPARSGQGRVWVPASQLGDFIEYLQALKAHLDQELPGLVEQVRAGR